MGVGRWFSEPDPDVLGAVVHGPAVVARAVGIVIAVRCVLAHPGGLEIDLVLRATGVQAEAASRRSFGSSSRSSGSEPVVEVELDGRRGIAYPCSQTSSGGKEAFASELRLAIPELPTDGRLGLTASWPEAGLAKGSVTLVLGSLDDLVDRSVRLTG